MNDLFGEMDVRRKDIQKGICLTGMNGGGEFITHQNSLGRGEVVLSRRPKKP